MNEIKNPSLTIKYKNKGNFVNFSSSVKNQWPDLGRRTASSAKLEIPLKSMTRYKEKARR